MEIALGLTRESTAKIPRPIYSVVRAGRSILDRNPSQKRNALSSSRLNAAVKPFSGVFSEKADAS
jgi:hypothetical protein